MPALMPNSSATVSVTRPCSLKVGAYFGNQVHAEAVVFHQLLADAVVLEVPEHAFREPGDGGARRTRQPHGNVVAGQHDLVYFLIYLRFVFLHPCQFAGGEVAR